MTKTSDPIETLCPEFLTDRMCNVLANAGIETVQSLRRFVDSAGPHGLKMIHGCGPTTEKAVWKWWQLQLKIVREIEF